MYVSPLVEISIPEFITVLKAFFIENIYHRVHEIHVKSELQNTTFLDVVLVSNKICIF